MDLTILPFLSPRKQQTWLASNVSDTLRCCQLLDRRLDDGPWREVTVGLPNSRGTRAYTLATHESEPGVFYAARHATEIDCSPDAGYSWERLDVNWPNGYVEPAGHINGLVVTELQTGRGEASRRPASPRITQHETGRSRC